MPLVSFVVTWYNFENYIGECLQSILQQNAIQDLQVIVIDDASNDGSDSAIRAIRDARVRYLRHVENTGPVASILEGLGMVTGRYVVRLDGDDRVRPDFLQATVPLMEREDAVGMVYGNVAAMNRTGIIFQDPWEGIRSRAAHGGQDTQGDEYVALLREYVAPAFATIMRTRALQVVLDGTAVPLLFDWYVALRVARTHQVAYRARTLADYRLHEANLHKTLQQQASYEPIVLRVLDQIFAEPDHAAEKAKVRTEIYAGTYMRFADVRFGQGDLKGARALYRKAFALKPTMVFKTKHARHFAATYLSPHRYHALKTLLKGK